VQFSSCYATLGGPTIGLSGLDVTIFTTHGACSEDDCAITTLATGILSLSFNPQGHTIGPAPDPNQHTIGPAAPPEKPGCLAYGMAVALGLDSFLEPGGGNNMPSVVPDTAKKEARDEAIKLVAQRVGGKAALATGNKIIFAFGVYDYFKTLEKGFEGRIAGKCSPLVP
jgi:hypothetical protein